MATHDLRGITQYHWRQASKVLDIPFIPKMLSGQRRIETVREETSQTGVVCAQSRTWTFSSGWSKKPGTSMVFVYRAVISVRRVVAGEARNSFLQQSSNRPQVAPLDRSTCTLHCSPATTLNLFADFNSFFFFVVCLISVSITCKTTAFASCKQLHSFDFSSNLFSCIYS